MSFITGVVIGYVVHLFVPVPILTRAIYDGWARIIAAVRAQG